MQIKEFIKGICVKQLDRAYEKQLAAKKMDYHTYVCQKEGQEPCFEVPVGEDFVVLCQKNGRLREGALPLLATAFDFLQQAMVLYGDEDLLGEDGRRCNPWYKPAWSPDTYLSQFYLGSVIAVRKSVWNQATEKQPLWQEKEKQGLHIKEDRNGCTITCISFEGCEEIQAIVLQILEGVGAFEKNAYTVCRCGEILFHVAKEAVWENYLSTSSRRACEKSPEGLVSVIIPSKDNPEVLRTCLESLKELQDIEIIVVDNGSSPKNRVEIEKMIDTGKYLYQPMPFNFSEMCNLGAREAAGKYYLFLNDDIETRGTAWLEEMKKKAELFTADRLIDILEEQGKDA